MSAVLEKQALRDLARCEAEMHRTRSAARDFWVAALEVYDRELWRLAKPEDGGEPYSCWSDYLRRRWPDINKGFASRKLSVARAQLLFPGAENASDRALTVIANQPPDVQEAVLEATDGEPTEAETRRLLAEMSPAEQKERIEAREKTNRQRIKDDGEKARRRQAEGLVERLVKLAEGFPETGDVAEVYFLAGIRALTSADDPDHFVPLQLLAEKVKEAMGDAA